MSQTDADHPWYVIHARPQLELLAAAVIETRLGLVTWLPEVAQLRRGERRRAPLFPGYLFVQADDVGLPLSAINHMPGVVRVVAFGPKPQPLAPQVIVALRAEVEAVNARGGLAQHPFKPGETVRLGEGPLAGMEALFIGPTEPAARVEILLHFLGSQRTLFVAPDTLDGVANPIATRPQPRRSRGKGRPISRKDETGDSTAAGEPR